MCATAPDLTVETPDGTVETPDGPYEPGEMETVANQITVLLQQYRVQICIS